MPRQYPAGPPPRLHPLLRPASRWGPPKAAGQPLSARMWASGRAPAALLPTHHPVNKRSGLPLDPVVDLLNHPHALGERDQLGARLLALLLHRGLGAPLPRVRRHLRAAEGAGSVRE